MSGGALRHYEVVMVVNPELSDQVPEMVSGYCSSIEEAGGTVTRREDWGRRALAYQVENHLKGHYVLLNFSCEDPEVADRLQDTLDTDDPVIRTLLTRTSGEVTEPSPVMAAMAEEEAEREPAAASGS